MRECGFGACAVVGAGGRQRCRGGHAHRAPYPPQAGSPSLLCRLPASCFPAEAACAVEEHSADRGAALWVPAPCQAAGTGPRDLPPVWVG